MALTTYSGLSTGVFRRLNRTADSAVFDDCISLAEAEMNRRLAVKPVSAQHKRASLTLSTEFLSSPTDMLDVDTLQIADNGDSFTIIPTSPQNMEAMVARTDATNRPQYYTQIGTEFRFYPAPDTSYVVTLTYWQKVPNLTSTASTNWMLSDHPDVYFHGVLAHAFQEYYDEPAAETQAALFDAALQKVLDSYPSRPDRAPLRSDISPNQLNTRRTVLV